MQGEEKMGARLVGFIENPMSRFCLSRVPRPCTPK
jgi:hypothetical protein